MRYRPLGRTGLRVSEIGFGAWAIGGAMWGPQDDRDSKLALHLALDMGCDFIDTAWVYGNGHSERLIGGVIRERHERPVIATKVPPKNWNWDNRSGTTLEEAFPADWVESKMEESRRNLGLDSIDVLQLHTWRGEWNAQSGPLLDRIARLKREGKVRAFGISLRDKGPGEANDLVRWGQVDCLQVFFNLLYQEPIRALFPLAGTYGVGIIARVPLAFGALSGKFNLKTRFIGDDHRRRIYEGEGLRTTLKKLGKLKFLSGRRRSMAEAALEWTLAYPEVSTAIPGIRNQGQAALNCGVGDAPRLEARNVRKAEALYRGNFGLPVRTVESTDRVHAVLMSGVRLKRTATSLKKIAVKPRKRAGRKKK